MQNKLKIILAVIIGVIIVVSSIPIISEFSTDITVSQHNDNVRYSLADDSDEIIVSWTAANGLKINAEVGVYTPLALLCDNLQYYTQSDQVLIHDIANNKRIQTSSPPTITFNDGTYSYDLVSGETTTTYTGTYSILFHAAKVGEYALLASSANTFKANIGNEVYAFTMSYYKGSSFTPISIYEYTDGVLTDTIRDPVIVQGSEVTSSSVNWNPIILESNNLNYTYSANGTLSYTAGTTTDSVLLSYIIPAKYNTTNSMTETVGDIVQFIPLLLIICLLIMAAYAIMSGLKPNNRL